VDGFPRRELLRTGVATAAHGLWRLDAPPVPPPDSDEGTSSFFVPRPTHLGMTTDMRVGELRAALK
jgi:hypothetical protein